jgi:hypothetical protein
VRSAFPLDNRTLDKSDYPLQDRHFRVSTPSYTDIPRKIRAKSFDAVADRLPEAAEHRQDVRAHLPAGTALPKIRSRTVIVGTLPDRDSLT